MLCRRQRCRLGSILVGIFAAVSGGLFSADALSAQVAWDSPMLLAPGTPSGVGLFLMDPHPDDRLAALVTYRASRAPGGLGLRFGIAEEVFDDVAIFAGADFSGPLLEATQEFPLDIIWIAGIGGSFAADRFEVGFPLGISLGRVFDTESARFVPYMSPRVVLDGKFGGDEESVGTDNLALEVAIDLGLDFAFSNTATLRLAAGIGDRDALVIGVALGRVR